jgi:hypothetical protein
VETTFDLRHALGVRLAGIARTSLLLAVSLGAALTAADTVVRVTDLGFRPLRSAADADAIVEDSEFRTRVRTNALGFREPRLPAPKPPGMRRIVVLGDSFTQGYGVEDDEAYPRAAAGRRAWSSTSPGRRR